MSGTANIRCVLDPFCKKTEYQAVSNVFAFSYFNLDIFISSVYSLNDSVSFKKLSIKIFSSYPRHLSIFYNQIYLVFQENRRHATKCYHQSLYLIPFDNKCFLTFTKKEKTLFFFFSPFIFKGLLHTTLCSFKKWLIGSHTFWGVRE